MVELFVGSQIQEWSRRREIEVEVGGTNGNKVGRSGSGILGGMNHYDNHGHKTGHTSIGILGGMNHYDNTGHKTGYSNRGILGDWNHYDN